MKNNINFFIEELENKEYLVYNKNSHIAGIFSETGMESFDILVSNNQNIDIIKKKYGLDNEDEKTLIKFSENLNSMNFYCTTENITLNTKDDLENITDQIRFYLHVTSKCNLKCNYCYNADSRKDVEDLNLDKWKIIIDKIVTYAKLIIITGGEPTLNENLSEIIEYIKFKKEDIKINMISNATTDYSKVVNFKSILNNLDKLTLSVDNTKITLSPVWSSFNNEKVNEIKEFANINNFIFRHIIRLPNTKEEVKLMPDITEFKNAVSSSMSKVYLDGSKKTDILKNKKIKCSAASMTFSIDSNGDCYPCQNFHFDEFNLGNILNSKFEEIYYNQYASETRKRSVFNTSICKDCKLKYICIGGCMAQTYKNQGSITAYPELLCSYYKIEAIQALIATVKSND